MDAAPPPLPPAAIEQPAPRQVSYGLITGRAARGTQQVVVAANGKVLAAKPLRGRRFSIRVALPLGDTTLRVTTIARGRRSSAVVRDVYGLPRAGRPRALSARTWTRGSRASSGRSPGATAGPPASTCRA